MVKIAGDNHKTRVKNTQKITSGIDKHKISCQNIIKIQYIVVHYKNYQAKPVIGVSNNERGSGNKKETDQQANDQNDRKATTYHRGQNTKSNTKPP